MDLTARNGFARELAREAGALALGFFRRRGELAVEAKGPQDWVSAADRAVEAHVREALRSAFPGDAMLVEEAGGRVLPYPGPGGRAAGGRVIASAPGLYAALAATSGAAEHPR